MGIASGYFAKNLWFLVNFRLKISRTPFFCTTFVLSLHETSKMLRIKKLDIFVLKSFCMLFMGTFFICLFIFMMQFLWRYVDEMVGKGLEMTVLAQFFFYSALSLVPASLPLAILLAALITFGNFGERFELLAMKAAGISLLKIMRPLIIFICFICCVSFYFQNVIGPKAQTKLWTLTSLFPIVVVNTKLLFNLLYFVIALFNSKLKSSSSTGFFKN